MLEYERLRSLHVLVDSLFTRSLPVYRFDLIDIDHCVASEPRCESPRAPRPSRGVGRLRPLDSNTLMEMLGLGFGVDVEDPTKVIPEEVLPFEALDVNALLQEEDLKSVRTG